MMLRQRVVAACLLAAVPVAAAATYAVDRVRAADARLALERVVRSQVNDQVRERCESDPYWFLAGPLDGRPKGGVFVETNPDQLPPRPRTIQQPFELFAYDEAFAGTSPASARFPPDFRRELRSAGEIVEGPYDSPHGTGVQVAIATGWIGGPCRYFLGRLEPSPGQARDRALTFFGIYILCALAAMIAAAPTIRRVRRMAGDARGAVDAGYTAIAPERLKDELSSFTFMYNDAAAELRQRRARIDDQESALRRFVQATGDEVAAPAAALERALGALASQTTDPARANDVNALLRQAHDLSAAVDNLAAAGRLRQAGEIPARRVDLSALVQRVADRHAPMARAFGVALTMAPAPRGIAIDADDALLERAIANVVDNAIRYNRPGGTVTIALTAPDAARFLLTIADDGPGVTADEFRGLTAVHRFRGDESRSRRPGAPGLGLAIAREVADRFSLTCEMQQPSSGGIVVQFAGASRT